jgi:MSHA pilin protein MshC
MTSLHPRANIKSLDAGFTIVELISVLVIVGILAAFALPRFFTRSTYDASGFFNQAQALVRYGQKAAIAQGTKVATTPATGVYVRLNGTSVALCYDSACASPVTAPSYNNSGSAATLAACGNSKTWACEASPAGLTYTASNTAYIAANPMFYFNPQGKPYNVRDNEPVSTFNTQLTITLESSSGTPLPFSFYIEQETGYVHH